MTDSEFVDLFVRLINEQLRIENRPFDLSVGNLWIQTVRAPISREALLLSVEAKYTTLVKNALLK